MPGNRRGRPRSASVQEAILRSTRELLASDGYERLTIEAIAVAAGVSRPALYRRWSSKAELVAEAVLDQRPETSALSDTGDIEADLREWMGHQLDRLSSSAALALVRGLAAAVAESELQGSRLYEHFTGPLRRELLRRISTAQQQGQIRADIDPETVIDALLGTLLYRSLTRHGTLTPAVDGPDLVAVLLHGIGVGDGDSRKVGR